MSSLDSYRRYRQMACAPILLSIALFTAFNSALRAGPADSLLRLVPPDSGATLAVEDLKGTFRDVRESSLYDGLRKLPVVREWLQSGRFQGIQDAVAKVEQTLGEKVGVIRDALLGEAFVLTLHIPSGGRPDEARGILLIRVPDRELLDRVVGRLNAEKIARGEIRRVSDRTHQGVTYHVRETPPGGHDAEFYASLDDHVFAWSNSEALIQGAIDRQSGKSRGLFDEPAFRAVRDGLPARAIAALYVDPRFAVKVLAGSVSNPKPEDERVFALVSRYLGAMNYAGASIAWRDGIVFQTREVFDNEKLTPGMKRWGTRKQSPDSILGRIPATALIAASGPVDPVVILDTITELVAPADRTKLANMFEALKGVMLGLNVRDDVAENFGPGIVAYIERPDVRVRESRLPVVVAIEIARSPSGIKAGAAVANALRTLLAAHALDPKNSAFEGTIQSKIVQGSEITALSVKSPYAFTVMESRLILGTSVGAVARALDSQSDPTSGRVFAKFRETLFPEATHFLAADLRAIHDFTNRARSIMSRRLAGRQKISEAEAARDLAQALALIELFDVAFLSSTVEPGFVAVNRSIGLVRQSATRP